MVDEFFLLKTRRCWGLWDSLKTSECCLNHILMCSVASSAGMSSVIRRFQWVSVVSEDPEAVFDDNTSPQTKYFLKVGLLFMCKSKSNFIRNTTCTRTNISIIINCQHVALHGCHLAKSRLPVTPSSLKNNHHYGRYMIHICSITTQYNRRIIKVKLHILLDITRTVLIK